MSWKVDKPCPWPGCELKIPDDDRYCPEHQAQYLASDEARRPSAFARGYTKQWQRESEAYLRTHDKCVKCGELAAEVDHIIPHRGDQTLFWDRKNWQAMCKPCHSRKTQTEDGRWFWRPEDKKQATSPRETFRING